MPPEHRGTEGVEADLGDVLEGQRPAMVRAALSVLGPGQAAEAEDVTQEALMRVVDALPGLRDPEAIKAWARRIAVNLAIDRRRTARLAKPHVGLDALRQRSRPGADPVADAEGAERSRAVLACLADLPDLYRAPLHLYYWLGHSVRQTAALLGLPEGTVKARLARGRGLIGRCLGARGHGDR